MQQPQAMIHQTTHVLPTALFHLRKAGCDSIDPFTLALAAWECERVESLKTSRERQQFQGLHLAACSLLGAEPHAPDLRPMDQRDDDSLRAMSDAYRWAGLAKHSHTRALLAYAAQCKQS